MKKKIDETAAGKGQRITLKLSDALINNPCTIWIIMTSKQADQSVINVRQSMRRRW